MLYLLFSHLVVAASAPFGAVDEGIALLLGPPAVRRLTRALEVDCMRSDALSKRDFARRLVVVGALAVVAIHADVPARAWPSAPLACASLLRCSKLLGVNRPLCLLLQRMWPSEKRFLIFCRVKLFDNVSTFCYDSLVNSVKCFEETFDKVTSI